MSRFNFRPGITLANGGRWGVDINQAMPQRLARSARPERPGRNPHVAPSADAVEHNHELLLEVLAGVGAKRGEVRLAASKALRVLSERAPELLYPHFDFFVALLEQDNQILKWNATLTLANLARVDDEAKIEGVLDRYLGLIAGPDMITAANAIRGAAMIGVARPHLAARIVLQVMRVDGVQYATPECRNVAIGHALEALEQLADVLPDQRVARLFAARQLGNPRAATSAKARRFLKTQVA